MANDETGDLVPWDAELSQEGLAYAARLRAELEPQISLVKRLRTALGLTQVEAARILAVTQANVSKIERRDDPTLSVLARMVEARGGKLRLEIETAEGDELRFAIAG